jgi:hypothetical protein
MTMYSAEIRDIVAKELEGVAEVTASEHGGATTVHVRSFVTNQSVDQTIVHGLGYGRTAREWARGPRKTLDLPPAGGAR